MRVRVRGCANPIAMAISALACIVTSVCVGAIFLGITGIFRGSDIAAESLALAEQNEEVTAVLGRPLEYGWWVSGSLNYTDNSGDADMTMPISGPRGSGRMIIRATREEGVWDYRLLVVIIDDTGQEIDLLR